jgi:cation diffusion facilitator CzcD-associated flavoprotein CzcO
VTDHHRAVVVGTGFSGLAASIMLHKRSVDHIILERNADVGGTWNDNAYPGCRCDVPSHLYSFSFAPNPEWSELFSPQPEIKAYLRGTAERFGVLGRIRFGTSLLEADWDDDAGHWSLLTSGGPLTCDLLILGNGPLSEPSFPDIDGLDTFTGPVVHSARWDPDVDYRGKRVAVVGTGASSLQLVPHVQRQASELVLFQRTPAWVLPHPNRRISDAERRLFRRVPLAQKALRGAIYAGGEAASVGLTRWPQLTRVVRRVALAHLRRQVRDPEKRRQLTPTYLPGCKRLLPSSDFYPAVDQPNVTLVTTSISQVTPRGIVTADGRTHEVDAIILGTGFHVTDNPMMDRVRGRDGASLAKVWAAEGMNAYLGSTVPGFPNMFMLAGPNTGIGHTSLVVMIEAQVRYLNGCLEALDRAGATRFDVRPEPCATYNAEVQRRMARTVWSTGGCASWYMDDQGRNPTLWPDFTYRFVRRTRRFDAHNYELS